MTPTAAATIPHGNELLGINLLLIGRSGAGKTSSLKTLLKVRDKYGLEIFAVFTEPRFDVLGKDFLDQIHWRYIPPARVGWQVLENLGKQINTMSNDALQKMRGINAESCTQYLEVIGLMNNFVDQDGKSFGDVARWGTNRALILDGFTGISKMSRQLAVGFKPTLSQPDWGTAMQNISVFVDTMTMSTRCHFIMIGHVESEMDELTGGTKNMVSTLGRKLSPTIPINFGDVILAEREGSSFHWNTSDSRTDLKPGNLPISNKLPADFLPVFDAWVARGGKFED